MSDGSRPRLLDLFCGAGGAAMGYHRAGFDVVGVDLHPQKNFPFPFWQEDALLWRRPDHGALADFDAIHASPPCQAYSDTRNMWNARNDHPDLVEPTRELLKETGLPWVMENVEGAPMARSDDLFGTYAVTLCGSMFDLRTDGFELRRHRLFESSVPIPQPQCRHGREPKVMGFYGDHVRTQGSHGNSDITKKADKLRYANEVMGIDWMEWPGICQAIPPAYTEFIGTQLLQHLSASAPQGERP